MCLMRVTDHLDDWNLRVGPTETVLGVRVSAGRADRSKHSLPRVELLPGQTALCGDGTALLLETGGLVGRAGDSRPLDALPPTSDLLRLSEASLPLHVIRSCVNLMILVIRVIMREGFSWFQHHRH